MIRQNKKLLLLTSVITLLPVFIGLFCGINYQILLQHILD